MFIGEKEILLPNGIKLILLKIHGTLDFSTAESFQTRLNETSAKDFKNIVVTLRKLSFIDSSGLTALLVGTRKIKALGGQFLIASIPETVAYTFEITSMADILDIYATEADAIRAIGLQG
jgi:stage II sporulation protein AA (anti-sigma F factor antagonist)